MEEYPTTVDPLSGAYLRGPGLTELQRELWRARRTGQSLTVVALQVDAADESGPSTPSDRLLAKVGSCLRAQLRPYDVIVRLDRTQYLCVLAAFDAHTAQRRFERIEKVIAEEPDAGSLLVAIARLQADDTSVTLLERVLAQLTDGA